MTTIVARKGIPKYNSHCHLGGEVPLATVQKYSSPDQMEAIQKGFAAILEKAADMTVLKAFGVTS